MYIAMCLGKVKMTHCDDLCLNKNLLTKLQFNFVISETNQEIFEIRKQFQDCNVLKGDIAICVPVRRDDCIKDVVPILVKLLSLTNY